MSQILSLEAAVRIWALPMFEPQCQASAVPSQQWFWVPLRHLRIESRSFVYCCPRNMASVSHQGSSYFTSVGLSPPTHCGLWERCQTQALLCRVRHAVHRRQQQLTPLVRRWCQLNQVLSLWIAVLPLDSEGTSGTEHRGGENITRTATAAPMLGDSVSVMGCISLFTIESSFKGQLMFLPL